MKLRKQGSTILVREVKHLDEFEVTDHCALRDWNEERFFVVGKVCRPIP